MNRSHEQVLVDVEQTVQSTGVTPDEVDAAIAEVLGVPADYYYAYRRVEVHASGLVRTRPRACSASRRSGWSDARADGNRFGSDNSGRRQVTLLQRCCN